MASISITGVQDTGVHPRREIHELVADTRQFSLFVQALLHVQEMDPEDPTSYYAIAGIHGYPYQPWPTPQSHADDADTETTKNKTQWLGYCTHGTVLFPTWHRPYILSLEQHLQSHATHLASLYITPDAPSWRLAAHTLRMPYWDWALHPLPPPEVIQFETVWVTTCKGKKEEVRNPLFSFVFPEGVRGEGFPKRYKGWRRTVRWPTSCDEDGRSDVDALKRALSGRNAEQTQAAVYRMLVNVHTWIEFSNHNSPLCSCSCTSTPTASTTAATAASPSSPSQSTTTSFPDEQHHTIKYYEDDTDDENEQDKKKGPDEFSNHTSLSCSCPHTSTTCTLSSTSSSRSPCRSQPTTTSESSSTSSRLQEQDRECPSNEDEKKGKCRCQCRCLCSPETSLEGIHDTLHNLLGGGGSGGKGHMASPTVAAYDPIFYLHHTNVDRLLAIWAQLNPETWVARRESRSVEEGSESNSEGKGYSKDEDHFKRGGGGWSRRGTWSVPRGVWVDSRTELAPFGRHLTSDAGDDDKKDAHNDEERRKAQKTRYRYWTSEDVRDTESFGYTYPELHDLQVDSSNDETTEKLDLKSMQLKEAKEREEREELERRVWVMYGKGVQGLFGSVGVVEEAVVSEREVSGDEEDEEDGERDDEGGEGVQQVMEEGVEEGVMLSGNVDPQPHLAPLPLPLRHARPRPRPQPTPSPSPTPMWFIEKSTRELSALHNGKAGSDFVGTKARRDDTQVWVWDWKARVRIREFDVGGGESVEVRVFLVPAGELYEDEESALSPSWTNFKTRDASPTSPRTDSSSTYSTTLPSSSTTSLSCSANQPTHHYIPLSDLASRGWDYDHPGYVGCVGTFVNEVETAEMCGNCMARRRLGSEPGDERCEEEGDGAVVQGTVYLSERIVEEMRKDLAIEGGDGERQGMRGLEPEVVLPFLRKRLRWGVWKVSNNAPIPLASLTPGTVEVDVCATRLSLPTSSMHEGVETGGRFPDVGETVWYTL